MCTRIASRITPCTHTSVNFEMTYFIGVTFIVASLSDYYVVTVTVVSGITDRLSPPLPGDKYVVALLVLLVRSE